MFTRSSLDISPHESMPWLVLVVDENHEYNWMFRRGNPSESLRLGLSLLTVMAWPISCAVLCPWEGFCMSPADLTSHIPQILAKGKPVAENRAARKTAE